VHQKDNTQKPLAKVKRTKEKMQTLESKKKVEVDSPKNVLKKKNKDEERGA